jgi:hypothetical protein
VMTIIVLTIPNQSRAGQVKSGAFIYVRILFIGGCDGTNH